MEDMLLENISEEEVKKALKELGKTMSLESKAEFPIPSYMKDRNFGKIDVVWHKGATENILAAFEIDTTGSEQQAKKNVLNFVQFYKVQVRKPKLLAIVVASDEEKYLERQWHSYHILISAFKKWGFRSEINKIDLWRYKNGKFFRFQVKYEKENGITKRVIRDQAITQVDLIDKFKI